MVWHSTPQLALFPFHDLMEMLAFDPAFLFLPITLPSEPCRWLVRPSDHLPLRAIGCWENHKQHTLLYLCMQRDLTAFPMNEFQGENRISRLGQ